MDSCPQMTKAQTTSVTGPDPVTVVLAVDEAYVRPATVALASLGTTGCLAGTDVEVWIVYHELSRVGLLQMERAGAAFGLRVFSMQASTASDQLPVSGWISAATYLRLAIPELFPMRRWVVYLDADVLALRDIRPLLEIDMAGRPLAAVRDTYNPVLASGQALPGYQKLGLAPQREYFNSGVLKLDLDAWRSDAIAERALRFARDHPEHLRFWDQCALNWAINDRWLRLPPTWNAAAIAEWFDDPGWHYRGDDVLPRESALKVETAAHLLHFCGRRKPWYPGPWKSESFARYANFMQLVDQSLS